LSNWTDVNDIIITTEFSFLAPVKGSRSSIQCQDGEVATWEYDSTDDYGDKVLIYDSSTGADVLIAYVYAMPGRDIFNGLFSTGAIPTLSILDEDCMYYRVDY